MHPCNILIGCDQTYYNDWGINLILSIQRHNPFVQCHAHVVNPSNEFEKIKGVDYTFETKSFVNDTNRLGYLQAARFLAVAEKFNNTDLVMTLDADTICTRTFTGDDFTNVAKDVTVLRHLKDRRWLAGCVTFGTGNFKKEYSDKLKQLPVNEWEFGEDQKILPTLEAKYQYKEINGQWMSIGKNGRNSIFLTLKGNQKIKDKYLKIYKGYLK